ncbi:MarR family winged helix-turn-helix transcriptional regulator [Paraconexibacter sp.]|uniref:MarR family winged helix-turn-helix transcriptional regulator n=1 Tax=Paraconexibacter sp. TaxID=2949640 RepID=UPI0035639C67
MTHDRGPVAQITSAWNTVHPDLDTTPMAVLGRVHRLSRLVAAEVETHFAASGISRGDYDVLATLRRAGGPLTPGRLQEGLLLSSAGITGRLNRLERAGRVRRVPSPDDGRAVLVDLTPEGQALVDRLVHEDMERQGELLARLSPSEQRTAVRLLQKLLDGVEPS